MLFSDKHIVEEFQNILLTTLKQFECSSHIYVFMPDHCHFLLQGNMEESDSRKAIINFKQRTGYWLSKNSPEFQWQKDFYDHILRSDESLNKHIKYILDNPNRKELCKNWKEYPFKGSTIYDLNSWGGYY